MSGFEVKQIRSSKITGYPEAGSDEEVRPERLTAILKVNREGYVPENVQLRTRIDDLMFTAEFDAKALKSLDSDELVNSVAISESLKIIE